VWIKKVSGGVVTPPYRLYDCVYRLSVVFLVMSIVHRITSTATVTRASTDRFDRPERLTVEGLSRMSSATALSDVAEDGRVGSFTPPVRLLSAVALAKAEAKSKTGQRNPPSAVRHLDDYL
jgi:hypothetical protein